MYDEIAQHSPVELRQSSSGTVRCSAVLLILDASTGPLAHQFPRQRAQMHRQLSARLASSQTGCPRRHQALCMNYRHLRKTRAKSKQATKVCVC
jgi:hypothetical protein